MLRPNSRYEKQLLWQIIIGAVFTLAFILVGMKSCTARDLGQWGNADPEVSQWYRSLKMPDLPNASCCGEADSYWCIEKSKGDQVLCVIDDDRDNIALRRTPVANGTIIEIPPHKINKDPNLAGHAIVFLSSGGAVYCFVGISGS